MAIVAPEPELDRAFDLEVGESATLEAQSLTVRFDSVTSDSRCPKDVSCFVAGEAVTLLELTYSGKSSMVTFRVPPGDGDTQDHEGWSIAIVALEPQTNSRRRIPKDDYVATILVTRKDAPVSVQFVK